MEILNILGFHLILYLFMIGISYVVRKFFAKNYLFNFLLAPLVTLIFIIILQILLSLPPPYFENLMISLILGIIIGFIAFFWIVKYMKSLGINTRMKIEQTFLYDVFTYPILLGFILMIILLIFSKIAALGIFGIMVGNLLGLGYSTGYNLKIIDEHQTAIKIVEYLKSILKDIENILILNDYNGILALNLARYGKYNISIVAPEMHIKKLNKIFEKEGLKVNILEGLDVEFSLPFLEPENKFDIIVIKDFKDELTSKDVLKEALSLLKENGYICIISGGGYEFKKEILNELKLQDISEVSVKLSPDVNCYIVYGKKQI